jgi:chemotaxis protein MotB
MRSANGKNKENRPIIIRREEVVEGGHHGGAWKVAYADFVTAMMAFFLLMWLLNATTEEQRQGLADYFSPHNLLSHASSGTGEPFGGHTAFDKGAMVSDRGSVQIAQGARPTNTADSDDGEPAQVQMLRQDPPDGEAPVVTAGPASRTTAAPPSEDAGAPPPARAPTAEELRAEQQRQERQAFEQAASQIQGAVRNDPALADLMKQLRIDMTPEGLRIQILDEDGQPMFPTGSAVPNDRTRLLLQKIAPVLMRLPEGISIAGHTDAAPFPGPGRTNWELSAERANATRRLLVDSGLPDDRIRTVTGHADREPLVPADPLAATNRRIAIVVLRSVSAAPSPGGPPQPAPQAPRQGALPPASATAALSAAPDRAVPPSGELPNPASAPSPQSVAPPLAAVPAVAAKPLPRVVRKPS